MVKTILFTLVMNVLYCLSFGQSNRQFSWAVLDQKNKPVIRAKVMIRSINKYGITNASGLFTIDDLPQTFEIEISCMGYETMNKSISITENQDYKFVLESAYVNLNGIVVEGNYAELKSESTPLHIEIVNDDFSCLSKVKNGIDLLLYNMSVYLFLKDNSCHNKVNYKLVLSYLYHEQ